MRTCPICHVIFGPCVAPPTEHIRGHLEDRMKAVLRKRDRTEVVEILRDARRYRIGEISATVTWNYL